MINHSSVHEKRHNDNDTVEESKPFKVNNRLVDMLSNKNNVVTNKRVGYLDANRLTKGLKKSLNSYNGDKGSVKGSIKGSVKDNNSLGKSKGTKKSIKPHMKA